MPGNRDSPAVPHRNRVAGQPRFRDGREHAKLLMATWMNSTEPLRRSASITGFSASPTIP